MRRLGPELDLWRHPGSLPARRVLGPDCGQIEVKGDGQTQPLFDERERDGDLTIADLAQLPAVLAIDPDRMLALFRDAGVVNQCRLDSAVAQQGRERVLARHENGSEVLWRHDRGR